MEGDIITMQDLFYYHQDGWGADGKMTGRHVPSGNLPSFMEDIRPGSSWIPGSSRAEC